MRPSRRGSGSQIAPRARPGASPRRPGSAAASGPAPRGSGGAQRSSPPPAAPRRPLLAGGALRGGTRSGLPGCNGWEVRTLDAPPPGACAHPRPSPPLPRPWLHRLGGACRSRELRLAGLLKAGGAVVRSTGLGTCHIPLFNVRPWADFLFFKMEIKMTKLRS